MTVRPEKSTRFPERLPRNRPCFPLRRWQNPRMGLWFCHKASGQRESEGDEARVKLTAMGGIPGISELMYMAMES